MIEKYVSTQSRNVGLLKKCRFAQLQPLARMVLVSINRVDECINRADQRATGGHVSPPLRFVEIFAKTVGLGRI